MNTMEPQVYDILFFYFFQKKNRNETFIISISISHNCQKNVTSKTFSLSYLLVGLQMPR